MSDNQQCVHNEGKELFMTEGVKTIIYPVTDLARNRTLYSTLLGVQPYADEAYDVGFNVEGQDVGLDPHGRSQGMTAPVGYWHVDDIVESLKALLDAGSPNLCKPVTGSTTCSNR